MIDYRIGVITTGRQDWGILRSTCHLLAAHGALRLVVGGMHVSATYGKTISMIEQEQLEITARLPWSDLGNIDAEVASVVTQMGSVFSQASMDALMLVGDRYETMAVALAATLHKVPLIHLHGGEETEGAIDNCLRHAISKLSHLHFVSHPSHRLRLIKMGECEDSIHVVGAPGLDNVLRKDLPSLDEIENYLGIKIRSPLVLVTLHPATLSDTVREDLEACLAAMQQVPATYVVTLPNSDPSPIPYRARLREVCASASPPWPRVAVDALGERMFWGLLRHADAMLGNSSAALIEAPILGVPAVNIGVRQRGRQRGSNVIDVGSMPSEVVEGLKRALAPTFRQQALRGGSPFGDGHAAEKIVRVLEQWRPPDPPVKRSVIV